MPFCRSKKYQDLVKKSGEPAPAPIVTLRRVEDSSGAAAAAAAAQAAAAAAAEKPKPGFKVKPAVKSAPVTAGDEEEGSGSEGNEEEEGEEGADGGSDWETASEEEMQTDEVGFGFGLGTFFVSAAWGCLCRPPHPPAPPTHLPAPLCSSPPPPARTHLFLAPYPLSPPLPAVGGVGCAAQPV